MRCWLLRCGHLVHVRRHQVAREVRLHISLLHEHIIKLYAAFEDAEHVVLVQVSRGWQAGGYGRGPRAGEAT